MDWRTDGSWEECDCNLDIIIINQSIYYFHWLCTLTLSLGLVQDIQSSLSKQCCHRVGMAQHLWVTHQAMVKRRQVAISKMETISLCLVQTIWFYRGADPTKWRAQPGQQGLCHQLVRWTTRRLWLSICKTSTQMQLASILVKLR